MILLDTHALLWLANGDRRSRALTRSRASLRVSPATVLELQFPIEAGRLRTRAGGSLAALETDDRWRLDDPQALAWFAEARAYPWTRDPFDRLLVAHASLRRWRFATADEVILGHLSGDRVLDLS